MCSAATIAAKHVHFMSSCMWVSLIPFNPEYPFDLCFYRTTDKATRTYPLVALLFAHRSTVPKIPYLYFSDLKNKIRIHLWLTQ